MEIHNINARLRRASYESMCSSHDLKDILGRLVIALDGPAGSGKTTTARAAASVLGLRHIDTGAMYRAVTWKALDGGVDPEDEERVGALAGEIRIEFSIGPTGAHTVTADGRDVTREIRSLDVTRNVSLVSSYAAVRRAMVPLQRRLAGEGGAVLEGRDIGSVVLPDADVKVFLTASVDERARRRFVEFGGERSGKTLDEMRADIERRDRLDSSREISPLKVSVGAHVLDTTGLSIDEQVSMVADIARETASLLCARALDAKDKDPGARRRPSYAFACLVIRSLSVLFFGLRVVRRARTRYAENYIYASNHRSNADPPIVGATVDREVHYMAKENLFRSRFLSRLITHYNAISTRRGIFDRHAFQRAEDVLNAGGSLLIFPEGTRIRGSDLGEAKTGVGFLALRTRVPVVPIYVEGTQSLKDCLLRRTRVTVVRGRPIRVQSEETAAPTAENCREFGSMVMTAIAALRDEARGAGDL